MIQEEPLTPNITHLLSELKLDDQDIQWVKQDTAILIVHGIGNQMPIETLDQFGRGLVKVLRKKFNKAISLHHYIVPKDDNVKGYWMDNVLRISMEGQSHHIDIYEYYWAHYTEDQASWSDMNNWLEGVVRGAKAFYKRNAEIGKIYKDTSTFFDSKTGEFKVTRYRLFVSAISKTLLTIDGIIRFFIWALSLLPLFGRFASSLLKRYTHSFIRKFTNVLGDVVVYNVIDPKTKFYDVRRKIQEGGIKALRYIIERTKEEKGKSPEEQSLFYESVIVAGHSLGSQVAYDAINQLNLLVNQEKISNYNKDGKCTLKNREDKMISDQLSGFITFGSPLDKIVFFLRENVPDNEYIRQQVLRQFHCFKIRDLDFMNNEKSNEAFVPVVGSVHRFLDKIRWRNYFDNTDYVSGGLDYFDDVTNIDCEFKAGKFGFTHSDYWTCDGFYKDILINYLKPKVDVSSNGHDTVAKAMADIA
jgi:hypothetical protein